MWQRVLYGLLALLVVLAIVLLDVAIARVLLDPTAVNADSGIGGALCSNLDAIADTPLGCLLARGSVIPLSFCVILVLGAFEMSRLFRRKAARPHTAFAVMMIVVLVLSPWFCAAEWLGHRAAHIEGMHWQVVFLMFGLVGTAVLSVLRRRPEGMLRDIGATWIMMLWLGFLPSFAVQLRCGTDVPDWRGAWLLLIALLVIKFSDIGAYFVGTTLGRRKLAPQLSPAKSVEGMIGGLAASAAVAVLIAFIGSDGFGGSPVTTLLGQAGPNSPEEPGKIASLLVEMSRPFGRSLGPDCIHPLIRALIFGLVVSAAGQIGDLLESGFKRDAGIKDSGRLLPRFGGILDLVDSPVLAMPVAWFLLGPVWSLA